MIQPVKTFTTAITQITDGDFTLQIPITGNDEITAMSIALNEFVEIMLPVLPLSLHHRPRDLFS